jgi:hypothetical protein
MYSNQKTSLKKIEGMGVGEGECVGDAIRKGMGENIIVGLPASNPHTLTHVAWYN